MRLLPVGSPLLPVRETSPVARGGGGGTLRFLLWSGWSSDLELGHQSPHFPELVQDEDVRDFGDYPHDLWRRSGDIQPLVSAGSSEAASLSQAWRCSLCLWMAAAWLSVSRDSVR